MRPGLALVFGGLSLAITLVAACGAFAPVDNDPVPLPADLAAIVDADMGIRLSPADGSVPPISATKALEIAGKLLLDEQEGNNVPPQDPSVPDALVRRLMTGGTQRPPRQLPPTSVWLVVYRWAAGFDCHSPAGGPGPCATTSFFVIDDRTGEVITSHSTTRG